MLKQISCGSEAIYDDFCLWDFKINPDYCCMILIATVLQRCRWVC